MENKSLKVFKALADQSRLSIITSLMEGPLYVELLSERLKLSPSTISFHLKKLEEAGLVYSEKEQYYVVYHIKNDIFDMKLTSLLNREEDKKAEQDTRELEYNKKVIDTFFEYGKLKSIPVQRKKRRIILEQIAKAFEADRTYTEREVNIIIADYNDDFCTIRREFISEGIFERENGVYWLKSKE
jgi:ArsR family transcriptional regulator, arsenate/arsenite/antimonite-responsive transcriptional repressor